MKKEKQQYWMGLEEDRKDLVFYLHKNRQEIEKVEEELKKYKK